MTIISKQATASMPGHRRVAILVAKAAFTGAAQREAESLAAMAAQSATVVGINEVRIAFTEQGSPTLREVLLEFIATEPDEIVILPWMMPVEPGFTGWIKRVIERWRSEAADSAPWPATLSIRLSPPPSRCASASALLAEMIEGAADAPSVLSKPIVQFTTEGSVIPGQKYRVLVCQGGPCNNAGAPVIWGHLRNEQQRLNLRTQGDGMMSARASCLGPCALAPVVQVFPDGTYYGGVDEAGVDRILSEHIGRGSIVADLAYAPLAQKQRVRIRSLSVLPTN